MAQRGSVAGKRNQSFRCASVEETGFPKAVAGTQEKADLRAEVFTGQEGLRLCRESGKC